MDDVDAPPEPELLASARRGDPAAFEGLVASYRGELYTHPPVSPATSIRPRGICGGGAWSWPSSRHCSICGGLSARC